MGVIIYSFNLNISLKMSYGVLECDIAMIQNYMLMIVNKRICNKGGALFVPEAAFSCTLSISIESLVILLPKRP